MTKKKTPWGREVAQAFRRTCLSRSHRPVGVRGGRSLARVLQRWDCKHPGSEFLPRFLDSVAAGTGGVAGSALPLPRSQSSLTTLGPLRPLQSNTLVSSSPPDLLRSFRGPRAEVPPTALKAFYGPAFQAVGPGPAFQAVGPTTEKQPTLQALSGLKADAAGASAGRK